MPKTVVRVENLSKAYEQGGKVRKVLDDVTLDIYEGEFFVLLGKSGSGKSTLLNLVSVIDTPDSGKILVNDIDLTNLNEREQTLFRRDNIGIVFQFFNLIPTLTVLENITLPQELAGKDRKTAEAKGRDLLAQVGLENRADSFPDKLSGGEQQRIAIARALAHEPAIVLADEPTGNLDPQTSVEVMKVLQEINQTGRTILIFKSIVE